jgi:1-acyl-sn-glycerol-3-phosphate acyltransferase
MDILLNIEFDYDGNEFQPLCVCNHVSELDPVLLTMLFDKYKIHYRFVSDERIKHWPIIGPIADHYDTIYITRDKRGIEQLKHSVKQTDNVCIFPEGTLYYKDTIEKKQSNLRQIEYPAIHECFMPEAIWVRLFTVNFTADLCDGYYTGL